MTRLPVSVVGAATNRVMATSPNVSANLLEAERLISEAAESGAGLVVLPENFAFIGRHCKDTNSLREAPNDGPLQAFLSQLAARLGIWLVGGTIPLEADHAAKWRAACTVYDEEGRQVGRYDKQHLFDVNLVESDEQFVESETIEAGDVGLTLPNSSLLGYSSNKSGLFGVKVTGQVGRDVDHQ